MSEQEFFQGPQFLEQQPLDDAIHYPQQPYYWSSRPDTPKEEPAARYDEPMVQGDYANGYAAQETRDALAHSYQQSTAAKPEQARAGTAFNEFQGQRTRSQAQFQQSQQQRQRLSPDGDAFEWRYRPHASYNAPQWSVPSWARPQRQRRSWSRTVLFLIVGLLLIKPLLILFAIFGVVVLAILLPLLIVGLILLIPFALVLFMGLPYILFRAINGRPLPQRRGRYSNSWRSRWW